ncbi:MAG: 16S rRNA (adenine(1518)-N(6)/adenine(1519)-N(6))-dimethyltransferase RsmA [Methanobrevibacter sp.]|nr:16S rRNA (adenine(1518)-N(6)/adenine(1519)-N(6))-dimethyltransferase RsmA [Methanobrevibacter sp.]
MKPYQKKTYNPSKENNSYSYPTSKENNGYLSLAKQTKKILQNNKIQLKKNLGQNYLIDDFKRKKIINFGNLNFDDVVLEIGPGIGTLTLEIAKKVKKVVAIEQDIAIFKILKHRLEEESIENVELINKDALKIDFPYFNKIISNLPYQISSPITFKFLEYDFDLAILMYQKEFADRMVAKVGSKNYSRLSAMLHFKGNVEFLDSVSPESFIPKPKVTSSIVKLTPLKNKSIENNLNNDKNNGFSNEKNKEYNREYNIEKNSSSKKIAIDGLSKEYSIICKALFQHKNKKIKNALIDSRHILGYYDKKEIRQLLNEFMAQNKKLDFFLMKRTIATSPEEILKIANYLKPIIKIS